MQQQRPARIAALVFTVDVFEVNNNKKTGKQDKEFEGDMVKKYW